MQVVTYMEPTFSVVSTLRVGHMYVTNMQAT